MTPFPHNLVLDPRPRFGPIPVEYSVLCNFLINKPVFMKTVAKCLACACRSYKVHVTVCNPIPLNVLELHATRTVYPHCWKSASVDPP